MSEEMTSLQKNETWKYQHIKMHSVMVEYIVLNIRKMGKYID